MVTGLCKSYSIGSVLSDVSFRLFQGEAVSLVGANGSGKTSLLRCCLRLTEPEAGQITVLDKDMRRLRGRALRRHRGRVALIWQKHHLVPRLSVLSNVIHGALARSTNPMVWRQGIAPTAMREEALGYLNRVGIVHLAKRRADSLSGGESQRVAIARALMQRPRIVFADEPVASLDPRVGEEVMQLFFDLIKKQALTLLFVSHNLDHALAYSDRIIGLTQGRIELDDLSQSLNKRTIQRIYG